MLTSIFDINIDLKLAYYSLFLNYHITLLLQVCSLGECEVLKSESTNQQTFNHDVKSEVFRTTRSSFVWKFEEMPCLPPCGTNSSTRKTCATGAMVQWLERPHCSRQTWGSFLSRVIPKDFKKWYSQLPCLA